jgi:putrescine transport system ATP-binding protein
MVTHDQEEAMTMANRVGVMKDGAIQQVGSPFEVYESPNSRFVGDFIGNANMIAGQVVGGTDGEWQIESPELGVTLSARHGASLSTGLPVTVMVRPEKMTIGRAVDASAVNRLSGTISDIAYLGDLSIYHVLLATGTKLKISQANLRHGPAHRLQHDDRVAITWQAADAVVLLA